MSRTNTRIRWTAEERASLVRRCQTLRASQPDRPVAFLLEEGQKIFPPERRRAVNAVLRGWLIDELKRQPTAPGEVTVWRPERPEGAGEPGPAGHAGANAAAKPEAAVAAPGAPSPVMAALIESGVQMLVGILADSRVRSAIAGAIASTREASPPPQDGESAGESTGETADADDGPSARRGKWVVVAGLPADDQRSVQRALRGTLDVKFWAPDQPREQLQEWLDDARVVIGMNGLLSPAIESSLERLGDRYVHHSEGVSGLYKRLAAEALR